MSDAFELEICQGKYRYRYEAGKQEVWRNGDIWPTMNEKLIGDKFVFSLAVELDEALKERDALRAKIERMEEMQAALRRHHEMAMCEGCDHSHPLTQLRLSAYQQSKLYADTVSVLEGSK